MRKLKEILMDKQYMKASIFVSITIISIYIIYLVISNFSSIIESLISAIGNLTSAFSPLLIGLLLSYLLSPLVEIIDNKLIGKFFIPKTNDPICLERHTKRTRTISILLTFLLILGTLLLILYAFTVLILGQVVFYSLESMIDNLVLYFTEYEKVIYDTLQKIPSSGLDTNWQETINHILTWFSQIFNAGVAVNFVANIGNGILNFVLGTVVSFYLLKDRDFFLRLWRKTLHLLLPMEQSSKFSETLREVDVVIARFLRGQLLDGLIIAILSSIGLTLIGLDFAVFIGCFAGIANIIPYFGPILGMIPAAIVGLLSGSFSQAAFAILVLFIIQQIDGAIISPKVVGSSTGLHPVFVLVAVTVGGYYWGILGMLLAVPVTAILKLFLTKKLRDLD
ncbi:MAG: AI-2E family transporter [Anaerovorax sp.]|nr:AI-2E family transporter [Anaerovorax sp.]